MEEAGLKSYRIGDVFSGYCVIRKVELKYKKNGESYLNMEFGDSSGRLSGKIWSNVEEQSKKLKAGQVVIIQGKIQQYRHTKEIHVDRVKPVREADRFMKKELLPVSHKDIGKLRKKFFEHKSSINNPYLKELLNRIFSEESFLIGYLQMPSGKLWHHQYLYGTLEHLVCMLDLSDIMFRHYGEINLELLKMAMITHFLGNVLEFDQDGYINYSKEGRLLGHALLTIQQLDKYIGQVKDFPPEMKIQLYHLIICDKSADGQSSQVLPLTREAVLLSNLMRLDIQANAVERIIRNDKLEYSQWTKFNNLFNRFIYTGKIPE